MLFNGAPYTGPFISLLKRHGVTEVLFGIGNPAAVEANKLRIFRQFLDLFELFVAGQHTDMDRMFAVTDLLCHHSPPS
jgi:hypothetical protein